MRLVRNLSPFVELYKMISVTRIEHLYVRMMLFNEGSELEANRQHDVFFPGGGTYCAGVLSAMSGIDHHGERVVLCKGQLGRTERKKRTQKKQNQIVFVWHHLNIFFTKIDIYFVGTKNGAAQGNSICILTSDGTVRASVPPASHRAPVRVDSSQ